ncbi:MAG: accessory factor UbiK family protein [Xanthomonadales bacterium]|nr:accessory factor UbiK family protein [Xanthomonadales bacterium]
MIDLEKIDQIVSRLGEALPPGASQMREEAEARFRAVIRSAFDRMEVVSREEFEAQRKVLERAQAQLAALENRIAELEKA